MSRARTSVDRRFDLTPTKYGAELGRNALRGLSCFLAPDLRNPRGQHLVTAARLGPICGAVNRLRAGSYIFRGGRELGGTKGSWGRGKFNPNQQICNACGRCQPGSAISHVLASPPSGKRGCLATRGLVTERHDRLASKLGDLISIVRRGNTEERRLGFEVPSDSDLRVFRKGSSKKRAVAVVVSALEAVIIEVSVTNSWLEERWNRRNNTPSLWGRQRGSQSPDGRTKKATPKAPPIKRNSLPGGVWRNLARATPGLSEWVS